MTRNENNPIYCIRRTGAGSGYAARKIEAMLTETGALLIAVADTGEAFALNPAGARARAVEATHPEWLVGVYTHKIDRATICADIRERARELVRAAA